MNLEEDDIKKLFLYIGMFLIANPFKIIKHLAKYVVMGALTLYLSSHPKVSLNLWNKVIHVDCKKIKDKGAKKLECLAKK